MASAIWSAAIAHTGRLFPSMPKNFEIVMAGLDGAGKTSLLNRLKRPELPIGVLPETVSTIGNNIETIAFGRHSITIWDFPGAEKLRPTWRSYFWHGHAFVFVVDSNAPERFALAKEELHWMCQELCESRHIPADHPMLVLANKTDSLNEAVDLAAISEALDVDALATRWGRKIAVKGVSAMTGDGLNEALEWLVANVSHEVIARHTHT
ncbi:ADP-ribosylation factor family-domain-containing protein [Mycena crocata]|nr:ADP-ribosylation factor family-domain-containing protein [Mycena crocata]